MGTAPQEMPTTITTPWVRLLTTVVGDLAGVRLLTTVVGDLAGRSTANCRRRCLISVSSSQTKFVVKLVSSLAAAVAMCTAAMAHNGETLSSLASTCCAAVPGRRILSAWK